MIESLKHRRLMRLCGDDAPRHLTFPVVTCTGSRAI